MASTSASVQDGFQTLAAILDTFQNHYQGDPTRLLNAIPADELWRFFINLDRQSFGQRWKDRLIGQGCLPEDFEKLALSQFMEKYGKLFDDEMKKINKLNFDWLPGDYYHQQTQALFDSLNGWVRSERANRGYLAAMLPQLHRTGTHHLSMDQDAEAFVNDMIRHIKELHYAASTQVTIRDDFHWSDDRIPVYTEIPRPGEFSDEDFHRFGFMPNSTSLSGFLEIVERIKNQHDQPCFLAIRMQDFSDGDGLPEEIIINSWRQKYAFIFGSSEPGWPYTFHTAHELSHEALNQFYKKYVYKTRAAQTCLKSTECGLSVANAREAMIRQFALEYYHAMKNCADSMLAKLKTILAFIQNSQLNHPFRDRNTVTLTLLLMNELLMSHGFPPVILADSRRSTFYSAAEFLQEVLTGMQKALELAIQGNLSAEVDSRTILEHSASDEERTMFYSVVAEEVARRNSTDSKPSVPEASSSGQNGSEVMSYAEPYSQVGFMKPKKRRSMFTPASLGCSLF